MQLHLWVRGLRLFPVPLPLSPCQGTTTSGFYHHYHDFSLALISTIRLQAPISLEDGEAGEMAEGTEGDEDDSEEDEEEDADEDAEDQ